MRVYLPSTLAGLRSAVAAGEISPPPLTACAVTPALREWYVEGDSEELEYVALLAAARASLRLLAADPSAPRRRVVMAADVADTTVRPAGTGTGPDRPAVFISVAVPLTRVAAVHVDDRAAVATVDAAVRALAAADADAGDEDAEFLVDEAEAHELQWYATSEISELVAAERPA